MVVTGRAIALPQAFVGVDISTILVACAKVQRAIVVFLMLASALASHFKVYVKFFYVMGKTVRRNILIGLVQVRHQSFSCDGQGAIRQAILYSRHVKLSSAAFFDHCCVDLARMMIQFS